ncbi:MAG: chitobiase/beta-hexosaminidase C-terminal domain-containing protein [Clostridiales bacterium]|nr:chitobiase/beta-hexosaminidase C-terminal domain-containing protein [Clostridiales bacterium]
MNRMVGEQMEQQMKKSIWKSKKVIIAFFILVLIVSVVLGGIGVTGFSKEKRAERKVGTAQKYVESLKYEDAVVAFEEAIRLDPRNMDAYLGLAEVYVARNQKEKAVETLERGVLVGVEVKEQEQEILDGLDHVFLREAELLEELKRFEEAVAKIRQGFLITASELLKEQIDRWSPEVTSSLEEGTYEEKKTVELSSAGKKIYYTTDGSEPTAKSEVYTKAIPLTNGENTIKAVAEGTGEQATYGEVAVFHYTLNLPGPDLTEEEMKKLQAVYDCMAAKDYEGAKKQKDFLISQDMADKMKEFAYNGKEFVAADNVTGLGYASSYEGGSVIYYGEWKDGEANGTGASVCAISSQKYSYYIGEWKNSLADGKGEMWGYSGSDVQSAKGNFKKGLLDGKIKYYVSWPDPKSGKQESGTFNLYYKNGRLTKKGFEKDPVNNYYYIWEEEKGSQYFGFDWSSVRSGFWGEGEDGW